MSKIVLCHGVFDVLHDGHLKYFEEAKSFGDELVVSITADKYVNKGPGRPYFNQEVRARMVSSLKIVDRVIISDSPRATEVIKQVKPAYYVKGPDYKDKEADITGGIYEEEQAVKDVGGELVFTTAPTHSSSTLINKFFNTFSETQREVIENIKSSGGYSLLREVFNEVSKQKVMVIGEPIVDTYSFCRAEGISSKSPTVSARHIGSEDYAGGSLAIANHLADFVKEVHLFAPNGGEHYYQDIKNRKVDKRVVYYNSEFAQYKTPRKIRFIDQDKNQRIFELTEIDQTLWSKYQAQLMAEDILKLSKKTDITLLCDFGHGLFENGFLDSMGKLHNHVALNCQTNSSNFGFNPYTKHKYFHYMSIDLKEASIAFHDRNSDAPALFKKMDMPCVSMTLGANGALYKQHGKEVASPAFADKVVDAIGAGDAYYAITALMWQVGTPAQMIPFVGNVFAGLKTKIIGNKHSVTKDQLLKALEAILK